MYSNNVNGGPSSNGKLIFCRQLTENESRIEEIGSQCTVRNFLDSFYIFHKRIEEGTSANTLVTSQKDFIIIFTRDGFFCPKAYTEYGRRFPFFILLLNFSLLNFIFYNVRSVKLLRELLKKLRKWIGFYPTIYEGIELRRKLLRYILEASYINDVTCWIFFDSKYSK